MWLLHEWSSGNESDDDNDDDDCRLRRLPPTMTREEFEEQVSPIPEHDNLR